MHDDAIIQTIAVAVFLGVGAQYVSGRLRIPSIVLYIFLGIAAGPHGLGLLGTEEITETISVIISLGVAVILFEGGMRLNFRQLRHAPRAIVNIILFGPVITLLLVAISARHVLHTSWPVAFMAGAVLTVTGPTVIAPLLERVRIDRKLHDILTWEGIIVDAFGAIIAVMMLQYITAGLHQELKQLELFFLSIGLGAAGGYACGKLLAFLVPKRIIPNNQLNLFILATILLVYWFANHIAMESGLLAATVAGLILGQLNHPVVNEIMAFKDQLSMLVVSTIFVLLSSRIDLPNLGVVGWEMVAFICCILLVIRPLMIFLTTIGTGLTVREKLFLSWIAPRGIIAASTASVFTVLLMEKQVPHAELLETIVFTVILATVILQGMTAKFAAKLFRVEAKPKNGYLIVGIHAFSMEIARLLVDRGVPIRMIDNDSGKVAGARNAGLDATLGNAMNEHVLKKMDTEEIGFMLALTENDEVNTVACLLGKTLFGTDHSYQVVNTFLSEVTDDLLLKLGGRLAFDMKMSIGIVNERIKNGRIRVDRLMLEKRGKRFVFPDNFLLPLFQMENGQAFLITDERQIRSTEVIALVLC